MKTGDRIEITKIFDDCDLKMEVRDQFEVKEIHMPFDCIVIDVPYKYVTQLCSTVIEYKGQKIKNSFLYKIL